MKGRESLEVTRPEKYLTEIRITVHALYTVNYVFAY